MKNKFSNNYKLEISRIESLLQIIKFPVRHFLNYLSTKNLLSNQQMVVFSSDHISHDINLDGLYEKDYLVTFISWLKAFHSNIFNGAVVDAGANVLVAGSAVFKGGSVDNTSIYGENILAIRNSIA